MTKRVPIVSVHLRIIQSPRVCNDLDMAQVFSNWIITLQLTCDSLVSEQQVVLSCRVLSPMVSWFRSFSPRHANSVDRKLVQKEVGAEFLTSGGFNMIQPPPTASHGARWPLQLHQLYSLNPYFRQLSRLSPKIQTYLHQAYPMILTSFISFCNAKNFWFSTFFVMAQPDPDPIPSSGSPRLFRKGLTHGVHFKGNLVRPCCPAVPLKDGEQFWFILMVYHSTSMCNYDYLYIYIVTFIFIYYVYIYIIYIYIMYIYTYIYKKKYRCVCAHMNWPFCGYHSFQ